MWRQTSYSALALIAVASSCHQVSACSTHGLSTPATLRADLFGDLNANRYLDGLLAIEDGFIAPTTSTNCVAGIGLGSTTSPVPNGVAVTTAQVVITNSVTGASTPLREFTFSANANTTTAFSVGSGASTPVGTNPLFSGSQWFGFVAPVDPFTLPTLGPDETFELLFELEIASEALPFAIPVQFAAGEGLADGTPIFTGSHPVTYFTASDPTASFLAVPEPGSLALWLIVSLVIVGSLFFVRQALASPER